VVIAPANQITLQFNGFYREVNLDGLPETVGIYCAYACTNIAATNQVALREVLYIGRSGVSIRGEIKQHLGAKVGTDWKSWLRSGEELCFNAAEVTTASERERAEWALIFKHKPPANSQCKDEFPFGPTRVVSTGKADLLVPDFTLR
jgi:hypothetical protein